MLALHEKLYERPAVDDTGDGTNNVGNGCTDGLSSVSKSVGIVWHQSLVDCSSGNNTRQSGRILYGLM